MSEEKNYKDIDYSKYEKHYNEESFWKKTGDVLGKVGKAGIMNALKLYYAMKLNKISTAKKAIVIGVLGYFICPFDLIPDFIPVAGFSDDVAALAAVLAIVASCIDQDVKNAATEKFNEYFNK